MSIVTVFDRHGIPLTELRTQVDSLEYVLNGVGQAKFTLALTDPKARQKYLEFGTYIEIQPPKLPTWAGKIDPDRSWDGATVAVTAYSGEYLLDLRGSDERVTLKGSAGDLFKQLVALANKEEDLLLRVGALYAGGGSRQEELGKHLLEHAQAVAERAENDFGMRPARDSNNKLYFRAEWYQQRGRATHFVLHEGGERGNMERTLGRKLLVERGPIVNRLTGLGDANTAGTRIRSTKDVPDSIARFGLRTDTQVFDGNKEQATLDRNTLSAVKELAWPLSVYYPTALDVGDLWTRLDLGNTGTIELENEGFEAGVVGKTADVRVLGMKYIEGMQRCELTLQEMI